jgi:hypothetical protein
MPRQLGFDLIYISLGGDADAVEGLGVLFSKLQQGVTENRQILTVARMRAEAEEVYGQRLADIGPAADKVLGGFGKDDGASIRKVRRKRELGGERDIPPANPVR